MSKRQALVPGKLATVLVTALFLSLSAHAGLLGGGVATGVTGGVAGNLTGTLGAPRPAVVMPPSAQLSGGGAGRVDATAAMVGQASASQAAAVSSGEDMVQKAERLTRRSRSFGEIVVEESADTGAQAAGRAIRIKQSGEASANEEVQRHAAGSEAAAALGANATTTAVNSGAATATRKANVSGTGSVSDSGSARVSGNNASASGDASAKGSLSY